MPKQKTYLQESVENPLAAIVEGIDHDVEWGEDMLMLGFCVVMLSSTFAPIAPPTVILPLVAVTFAISSGLARVNYHNMERKLKEAITQLDRYDKVVLSPIVTVFTEHPMPPLVDSYNFFKNPKRTWKSVFGGILINPLWMPIFYVMGIQINEEKNLGILNKAVIQVEKRI